MLLLPCTARRRGRGHHHPFRMWTTTAVARVVVMMRVLLLLLLVEVRRDCMRRCASKVAVSEFTSRSSCSCGSR